MSAKRKAKKPRPRKSQKPTPPVVDAPATRCPRCGSTDREPYHRTVRRICNGQLPSGEIYTAVVWRRTFCRQCGQARIDKSFEHPPA